MYPFYFIFLLPVHYLMFMAIKTCYLIFGARMQHTIYPTSHCRSALQYMPSRFQRSRRGIGFLPDETRTSSCDIRLMAFRDRRRQRRTIDIVIVIHYGKEELELVWSLLQNLLRRMCQVTYNLIIKNSCVQENKKHTIHKSINGTNIRNPGFNTDIRQSVVWGYFFHISTLSWSNG